MKTQNLFSAIALFLSIVYRLDSSGYRMSPATAWAVAKQIWLTKKPNQ